METSTQKVPEMGTEQRERWVSIELQNALTIRMERGEEISPSDFVDTGIRMAAHLGQITDKMHRLAQIAAEYKVSCIAEGDSVAKAEAKMEASDEFRKYKQMKSRVEQIEKMCILCATRSKSGMVEFNLNK